MTPDSEEDRFALFYAIVERLSQFEDWDISDDVGYCVLCGGPVAFSSKHQPNCILVKARQLIHREVAG